MNAQEAARILAKENDSVVVVGIRREATGDLISDECFLNLDEFHAAVVCANLVGYILKIQKRKNSIDHILKGVKQLVDVGIPLDEKNRKGLIAMAKKNGSLKLKIAACKKCKSQPRLKLGLSFYFECNCGQSISGAYGDGILETTRKWNEAQREDKNV